MKRIISLFSLLFVLNACNFLDVDPKLGITEEEVFTNWNNYFNYFKQIYSKPSNEQPYTLHLGFPLYLNQNTNKFTWYTITEDADNARANHAAIIKGGQFASIAVNWTTNSNSSYRPISNAMWHVIRVVNKCIENESEIQDRLGHEDQITDILGQCYFVRAYCHFNLCRWFGGMPYLDHSLKVGESWDLPRLSLYECYQRCANDFQTAYVYLQKAGVMRRDDSDPSSSGYLRNDSDMLYPNGCAALAMKARVLLYAASPLCNEKGAEDWRIAAEANAEAISMARGFGYDLVPKSNWTKNTIGAVYTNEQLWAWNYGNSVDAKAWAAYYGAFFNATSSNGATCPTQNHVDKYETSWGDLLITPEDRQKAITLGHYNENDPYSNRDPRLYWNIVYDGCKDRMGAGSNTINIYYDPSKAMWPTTKITGGVAQTSGQDWDSNTSIGVTNTGYYCYKYWNGTTSTKDEKTDPLIRLAELYLNYAEAVNEFAGPSGKAGTASFTAQEALNVVRDRVGMPAVSATSADELRLRIHNERDVEFAFEGLHHYFDIRRWKIAREVMSQPLYGMYVEKVDKSAQYPKGRRYERRELHQTRQCKWKDAMYFLCFPMEEINNMENFANNEYW